jgi:uncharacterized SAM-binding protein YcdF (DUF218 family)
MKKVLRRLLRIFIYFHVFLAAAVIFTHCTFTHYAKKSYAEAKKEKPYDVVIVPGVPFEGDRTTGVMKMRLFWAKHLYDSGFTNNIIFSGSSVYSPYIEAVVLKVMADSLGIPPDRTFSEVKAEHSTENVYYSWRMAREMGFKKIALATDPFQAGMLRSFMRRFCPGMKAIPIIFDTMDIDEKQLPKIDSKVGFVENFVPITERESFWQRFNGTLGRKVKAEALADQKRERESEQNSGN